ncbi:MAG TPA: DUF3017 domain-containing protein [Nocardioides sp.]|nr:DUF3017 domain-containing protein [Nocardioides sp.]
MTDQQQVEMTEDQAPEEPPEAGPRRYPSTIGGAFYIAVVLTAAAGLAIIGLGGSWRLGLRVLSGALVAAGLLRLVLRDRDAGMLAVRNRWLDATLVISAAVALTILSIAIPDQPV